MADTRLVSLLQSQRSRREQALLLRGRFSDFLIATYVCVFITVGLAFVSERIIHWFVLPVLLCGILIGVDAVGWVCRRFDIFDPVGVIGLVGFHMFFMAPLLHVVWDHWMHYIVPPPDWRPWLGGMAILNAAGLLIYRISRGHRNPRHSFRLWHLDRTRFLILVGVGLLLTGGLQYWVYARYGGLFGYILEYVSRTGGFTGMGWIFTLSESFPILALMGFAVYAQKKSWGRSWFIISVVLVIYWVLLLLFGGLRGSRSATIWRVFWAAGVIHFWIRPLSKKAFLIGVILIVLFLYLYGFYKGAGLEFLRIFESPANLPALEEQTGRTVESLLLSDLARSDVQAFLLYRLANNNANYEYAWGRTYLGGMAILIPRAIWPQRPPTKVKEGTEIQYGMGSYVPDRWVSSRVYGLAGEAMLNFGPFAVPFAFAVLGLVVGLIRNLFVKLQPGDARLLLYPFLVNLCIAILIGDSDNVVFFLVKYGLVPVLLLTLASRKHPVR
ncbi:MAG: hypothetical protein QXO76_05350 [Thermoproteota archaeon]